VRAPEQRSFVGRLAALSGRTGFLMLPRASMKPTLSTPVA
jgi:hypothetical protein